MSRCIDSSCRQRDAEASLCPYRRHKVESKRRLAADGDGRSWHSQQDGKQVTSGLQTAAGGRRSAGATVYWEEIWDRHRQTIYACYGDCYSANTGRGRFCQRIGRLREAYPAADGDERACEGSGAMMRANRSRSAGSRQGILTLARRTARDEKHAFRAGGGHFTLTARPYPAG